MVAHDVGTESVNVAAALLNQKRISDPHRWAHKDLVRQKSDRLNLFWWNDEIPLIEMPLFDLYKRAQDGYFLVSGDRPTSSIV
jgi:hypothetical protein